MQLNVLFDKLISLVRKKHASRQTFRVYWRQPAPTGSEESCKRWSGSVRGILKSVPKKKHLDMEDQTRNEMLNERWCKCKNCMEMLSFNRLIDISWSIAVWKHYLEEKLMYRGGADTLTGSEGTVWGIKCNWTNASLIKKRQTNKKCISSPALTRGERGGRRWLEWEGEGTKIPWVNF